MIENLYTIRLPLPFRMGSVNCYLVGSAGSFILIDTGASKNRQQLVDELDQAGCRPEELLLVLITHGDFDHIGNAVYLRDAYKSKIGMHADDAGMAKGDMFFNRKKPNLLVRALLPLFSRFSPVEQFSPDLMLADGDDLSSFGLRARVVSIPGHSKGSIGVLTEAGDLFCGDLLANSGKPALNSLMDDPQSGNASLEKLESLGVQMVYPGHGQPFRLKEVFIDKT